MHPNLLATLLVQRLFQKRVECGVVEPFKCSSLVLSRWFHRLHRSGFESSSLIIFSAVSQLFLCKCSCQKTRITLLVFFKASIFRVCYPLKRKFACQNWCVRYVESEIYFEYLIFCRTVLCIKNPIICKSDRKGNGFSEIFWQINERESD